MMTVIMKSFHFPPLKFSVFSRDLLSENNLLMGELYDSQIQFCIYNSLF